MGGFGEVVHFNIVLSFGLTCLLLWLHLSGVALHLDILWLLNGSGGIASSNLVRFPLSLYGDGRLPDEVLELLLGEVPVGRLIEEARDGALRLATNLTVCGASPGDRWRDDGDQHFVVHKL